MKRELMKIIKELQSCEEDNIYVSEEEYEESAKVIISAGEDGIAILGNCLSDAFDLRARMRNLLAVALRVAQHSKNPGLIFIFYTILMEGMDLVKGYPPPPLAWMPKLGPAIGGTDEYGYEYGWDTGAWQESSQLIGSFLPNLTPQLPAEDVARFLQAANHIIEKLEATPRHYSKGWSEFINGQINYWKSVKSKLPTNDKKEPGNLKMDVVSMKIEEVFTIKHRGTIVTGVVESGTLRLGDRVRIMGQKGTKITTVLAIETFAEALDHADPGQAVGVLLKDLREDDVEIGSLIELA